MSDIDVVIVCDEGDPHGASVLSEVEALGSSTLRYNLSDLRRDGLDSNAGLMTVSRDGVVHRVTASTTVWWHRGGTVDVHDLDDEEARLAQDEGPHILKGSLFGAGVRWVDDPADIDRAELKLHQLSTAAQLGIEVPRFDTTNDVAAADRLAAGDPIVAKALSSGIGIAPFVVEVMPDEIDRVGALPVLLQRLVETATADLRVVVIDGLAWVWRRPRDGDIVDWRAHDPAGTEFVLTGQPDVALGAARLTTRLKLTMSVQDWLETPTGPVFLEVNSQGAWLFLTDASTIVSPALAKHLVNRGPIATPGKWPSAIKRFAFDFQRAKKAPENDGAVAPTFATPHWIDEASLAADSLDVARRAHDYARSGAQTAEDKANRLTQTLLALLTVTVALGAYQVDFIVEHPKWWWWSPLALPILSALICLSIATFEAAQVDRVGFYHAPRLETLSQGHDSKMALLTQEDLGRQLAEWSSRHKHSDLMQARAWFTRGLAALILASVVAVGCRSLGSDPSPVPRDTPGRTGS